MAPVKSEVVADPPMSAVLTLPSLMTPKVALAMLLARLSRLGKRSVSAVSNQVPVSSYPRWRSIMVELRIMAVGLALLVPMMSEAT